MLRIERARGRGPDAPHVLRREPPARERGHRAAEGAALAARAQHGEQRPHDDAQHVGRDQQRDRRHRVDVPALAEQRHRHQQREHHAERGQREAEQQQAIAQAGQVAVQPGVGGQAPRALHDARLALLAGGQGLRERGVVAQRRVGLEILHGLGEQQIRERDAVGSGTHRGKPNRRDGRPRRVVDLRSRRENFSAGRAAPLARGTAAITHWRP